MGDEFSEILSILSFLFCFFILIIVIFTHNKVVNNYQEIQSYETVIREDMPSLMETAELSKELS